MATEQGVVSREREVTVKSGWLMLAVTVLLLVAGVALLAAGAGLQSAALVILGIVLLVVDVFMICGFFTLQPNQARVLVLFGKYHGTVRRDGFHWANPFYTNGPGSGVQVSAKGEVTVSKPKKHPRMKISLRARNLNGERLKVNDKQGNPIEIAAVIIWRVQDTAQAMFDVDDYEEYVRLQAESALRHLGSQYAYDNAEAGEITLRSGMDEVSQTLAQELSQRLAKSGIAVDEARLTHLAYAPEIAQAMLRRQQAEAVIAARQKIVQGAVSMVDMALRDLAERNVVDLDPERKAAMVSNLLVVLCGESEAKPVINAGTLYG
ncbi:MAG: SPFH domain-containing protein [Proteobacteria bacterium]|nr:SPFH domain-containing protein [Pseudomonadota bacterium]